MGGELTIVIEVRELQVGFQFNQVWAMANRKTERRYELICIKSGLNGH